MEMVRCGRWDSSCPWLGILVSVDEYLWSNFLFVLRKDQRDPMWPLEARVHVPVRLRCFPVESEV